MKTGLANQDSEGLPASAADCAGGGRGNSQAEKPWAVVFHPYLGNRAAGFCPSDPTPRSSLLAANLVDYNGGIAETSQTPPAGSELALALDGRLTIQSFSLNSIFTHKSARYAVEGALSGFATEAVVSALPDPNLIMFSERNSEALNAEDNREYGNVGQDDYDTWVGEAALVRWGEGRYYRSGVDSLQSPRQGRQLRLHRRPRGDAVMETRLRRPVPRSCRRSSAGQSAAVNA